MLGLWHCYSWFISPTNLAASDNHCYMITEEQVVNCRQLVRPTVTQAVVISTACSAFSRRSDHKQVVPSSPEWARWPVKKNGCFLAGLGEDCEKIACNKTLWGIWRSTGGCWNNWRPSNDNRVKLSPVRSRKVTSLVYGAVVDVGNTTIMKALQIARSLKRHQHHTATRRRLLADLGRSEGINLWFGMVLPRLKS